jgi:hypothetical protein
MTGRSVSGSRTHLVSWVVVGAVTLAVVAVLATRRLGRGAPAQETPAAIALGGGPSAARATTESVLRAQGTDCFECVRDHGCLDPGQLGGTCEGTAGMATECGAGITETAMCTKTLDDMFRSKCAAALQETPCLCGTVDAFACLNGTATPNGPLFADYRCDFKSANVFAIQGVFSAQNFGAGQANALVQCAASYDCRCFGQAAR